MDATKFNLTVQAFALFGVIIGCTQTGGLAIEPAPAWEPSASGSDGSDAETDDHWGGSSGAEPPLPGTSTTSDDGQNGPVLIPAQSLWSVSVTPPVGDWHLPGFDASGWQQAAAPFGNSAPDIQTTLDPGAATIYARFVFTCESPEAYTSLIAHVRRADGVLLHLNGVEVTRSNAVGDAPNFDAEEQAEGNEGRRYLRFAFSADPLQAGENVLTATILRSALSNPYAFDLQMEDAGTPEMMYAQYRTRTYNGEYADRNVSAIWVERPGGVFVRTLGVWANVRREHLVKWRSASLDNAVDAVSGATRGSHRTAVLEWDLHDANGQPVTPGDYILRAEFTEENSNKGDPAGPVVDVPFTVGNGFAVSISHAGQFRDITLIAP